MARDFVTDAIEAPDFHPCNTPRGMMYYGMDVLTENQQKKLKDLKKRTVVEDEKYLAKHPQVRACVAIMIKEVLKERPRCNIHETIAKYFAQPRTNIEADISHYISSRKTIAREGDSRVDLLSSATSLISQFGSADKIIQTMSLDITRSFRSLGLHVSDQAKEGPLEQKLTEEFFIRKMLNDTLDAGIIAKEIEDLEEILRIESYRHFQDLPSAVRMKSRESAGFVTSEISKPGVSEGETGELREIFGQTFQETGSFVIDGKKSDVDGMWGTDEVEVGEIITSLLERVKMSEPATEVGQVGEEVTEDVTDDMRKLIGELMIIEDDQKIE